MHTLVGFVCAVTESPSGVSVCIAVERRLRGCCCSWRESILESGCALDPSKVSEPESLTGCARGQPQEITWSAAKSLSSCSGQLHGRITPPGKFVMGLAGLGCCPFSPPRCLPSPDLLLGNILYCK